VTHSIRVIDSHELIFVQQGRLAMFEEDDRFVIEAGQTLLLEAGRRHGGTAPYSENLRFYWVHFRLRQQSGEQSEIALPKTSILSEPERLTTLFRRFLDDQETGTRSSAAGDLNVMQMLYEIAQPGNQPAGRIQALIPAQRADEYIRVHATEPIGASDIANAVGYNPDYLGRVYKRVFGLSITQAVNRRRIHEAKRLLLESESTIDQIAARCGYSEAEYFRRVFRKQEAMTPSAFRGMYARMHVNSE